MSILETAKSIGATLKKIGNIELYQQILDLQAQALELLEENAALKREVQVLKEKAALAGSLRFEHNALWRAAAENKWEGPLCSKCWDADEKLVHLHELREEPGAFLCPACRSTVVKVPARPRSG